MGAEANQRNQQQLWSVLLPRGRAQHLGEWFSLLESTLPKVDLPDECKEHASILLKRLRHRKETATFVEGLALYIAIACMLISIAAGPIIVDYALWREPVKVDSPISWIINSVIYLSFLMAIFFISALAGLRRDDDSPGKLLDRSPDAGWSNSWTAFAGSWTVISLGAIFILAEELSRNTADPNLDALAMALSAATISVAAYYILAWVIELPLLVWLASKERKWQSHMADSLLVQNLLLAWNEANGEWKNLGQRVRVATHLERAAWTLEHGLARRFRPGDAITRDWLTNELRRKAGAIRRLNQNVYFPTGGGQQLVLEKCKSLLVCILTGDWNGLPSADIQPPKQDPLVARLLRLVQRLFNAFLPVLVLLALRGRVSIEPATSTYLWTVAIAWAVLGVLTITDPAIGGKVQVLKDSAEAIRGFQSEKP